MNNRYVHRDNLLVIYDRDLPNMASHLEQRECGFSIYKGVLVQWDEDQDTRILDFIDTLDLSALQSLAAVQEHEGVIALRWKGNIPSQFEVGGSVKMKDDSWSISQSQRLAA